MEDERDIKTQLLLTVHKAEEWDEVIYDRFRRIFWTDQVKSCIALPTHKMILSLFGRCWWDGTNQRSDRGTPS